MAKFRAFLKEYVGTLRDRYLELDASGGEAPAASPGTASAGDALSPSAAALRAAWSEKALERIAASQIEHELYARGGQSQGEELDNRAEFPLRSARCLALKVWERLGGSQELQRALTETWSPLAGCGWFAQWKDDGSATDLMAFLGSEKLPAWNPFQDFDAGLSAYGR